MKPSPSIYFAFVTNRDFDVADYLTLFIMECCCLESKEIVEILCDFVIYKIQLYLP